MIDFFDNIFVNRFKRGTFKYFMRDTFPVMAFMTFSTWILWKMTDDYDKICRQYKRDLSFKQELVEAENKVQINNFMIKLY